MSKKCWKSIHHPSIYLSIHRSLILCLHLIYASYWFPTFSRMRFDKKIQDQQILKELSYEQSFSKEITATLLWRCVWWDYGAWANHNTFPLHFLKVYVCVWGAHFVTSTLHLCLTKSFQNNVYSLKQHFQLCGSNFLFITVSVHTFTINYGLFSPNFKLGFDDFFFSLRIQKTKIKWIWIWV